MTTPIGNAVAIYTALRERIKAEFGLEDDEQTLLDTLEGLTDLNETLVAIAREARHEEAQAKALAGLVTEMNSRKARRLHRAERLRLSILWALEESGIKKIDGPDLSIGLSAGRKAVTLRSEEPADWPDEYCTIKREISRTKIREALEAGEILDLASFSNPRPTLNIRTK